MRPQPISTENRLTHLANRVEAHASMLPDKYLAMCRVFADALRQRAESERDGAEQQPGAK